MSDPEHWSALFGDMLSKLVSAAGWSIEFQDGGAGDAACWSSDDLDRADLERLRMATRSSRNLNRVGNGAFAWHEGAPDDNAGADCRCKVFSFVLFLPPDRVVRAALILGASGIPKSAFESEEEFLSFSRRMALFFISSFDAMNQAEIFRQIAASISLGGIVADRNGKVVMNIGNEEGEVPECLKPVFESPDQARKLLRQVVLDEIHTGGGAGGPGEWPAHEGLISTGGQDRCVLHAIPLRASTSGSEERRLLFAVLEPFAARCPSSRSLRRVYSLTPAEARVVERLVKGLPIKEIARVLKLSDNTVRTYLKRSFEKVGVSSQQQLIYAVSGMASQEEVPPNGTFETAAE